MDATLSALLPTDEDIASYEEHGFWISPVIIPPDVLDAAERGMARFYAGDLDRELPVRGWTPEDGDVLRKNDYSSLRVDELGDLVRSPAIGATAALLSGADSIRLWHDQLLYKPADAGDAPTKVGWHTDRQYWQTCSSERMLTAWVGFQDVDETNGAVSFLDGSHRWDVTGLNFFSQDLDGLQAEVRRQGFPWTPRPSRMRRGQVSFHHCRTVHGSGPNNSSQPRRSMAIHLQPGDNHWVDRDARHPDDDLVRLVDGVPDYTDPAICPQLYPR
jgi:ectoine hydroxylase-related dioxygenase (phytanoyl-CoA dioxygenase family)